ncbi:MAG: molybdopterin oxidoreductase family protein [Caldilineaceae bacterium]|nr:molybdopterin oxidoreductase family protein [Caldilineaceae bacterium]
MALSDRYQSDPAFQIITGVCPHDCPDTCSWQVAVARATGEAKDIWGHPHHPITRGRLCGKVDRYLERTYHADRLITPLRRTGKKGSGQFEAITWDEAMREIAGRLQAIIDEYGPEAILPYSYAGTMGLLQGEGMASRFFNRMGASKLARTICSQAGFEGHVYTIGATEGMETEAFAHSKLILIWGSNTLTSNLHLWQFVQAARKDGARVVVIDPARTRTAQAADEWIPIRPGTDAALALAMMHHIIAEELTDLDYVARYTVGFEELSQQVRRWTPERAARITGVEPDVIRALAKEYATTRPAAIRINYGIQRHHGGGMAVRTVTCLPALTGAWRDHGGGLQLSNSGSFRHLDRSGLERPDLLQARTPRVINMNRLGDALRLSPAGVAQAHYAPRPLDKKPAPADAGPPVKAILVYNSNPAAVAPDQAAVHAGLRRDDLFTVVLEQFQTDTADYADYILPATTQLEHWDILKPYGSLYLGLNRPAIAPVGESLPNSEIFRRLAQAMGYREECFSEDDETILRRFVEAQKHARFDGITWERLLEEGFARLNLPAPYLPFAQGDFPTPSGKCEFYSRRMADDGYEPLPTFTPPLWLSDAEAAAENRTEKNGTEKTDDALLCISPPAHSFLNSTFANQERFLKREDEPVVQIHPHDAAERGITDGASVEVHNERGSVVLTARITDGLIPGTVLAPGVWWAKFSPDGCNINQVTRQDETDMGAGACFYDVRVWVKSKEISDTANALAGAFANFSV